MSRCCQSMLTLMLSRPCAAQLVDHVQRHPDVAHEDLHRRLRVLVLQEQDDAVLGAALRRLAEALDEPGPALRVGRLERVVVALDPRPDDEVGADRAGEVAAARRPPTRLLPRRGSGEIRPPRPKRGSRWRPLAGSRRRARRAPSRTSSRSLRRELARVVELVAVDHVAEAVDSPTHALDRRLAGSFRLIAGGNEPGHHRAEGPDPQARLHARTHLLPSCHSPPSGESPRRPRRNGSRPRRSPRAARRRARPRSLASMCASSWMNVSPQPTMCPGGHQKRMNGCSGSVTRIRRKPLSSATSSSFSRSTSKTAEPFVPLTSNAFELIRPRASREASSVPATPFSNSTVATKWSSTCRPGTTVRTIADTAAISPTR